MTIQSVEEAMVVLKKAHGPLIKAAREIAVELCKRDGTTHSRAVRAVMVERGLLPPNSPEDERWFGAVFTRKLFEATGKVFAVESKERNIHRGRDVKIWKLRETPKKVFKNGDILVALDNPDWRYRIRDVHADRDGVHAKFTTLSDNRDSKSEGYFHFTDYRVEPQA